MSKLHPLKLKRLEMGFSQHALAFTAGVPQLYICYAEKGYPALKSKHKKAICKALNCDIDDLFPGAQ